ncbi:hypothetical protein RRG08_030593 [Elysia crispata]|uniref:Sodium/solute symporter n=1 Tax=Elysia crispata TaxID=231223 RepID=A0AAE0Y3Y3_9GAST|nr:hypothetical protein RRG08_030593 [Elysia crispata]
MKDRTASCETPGLPREPIFRGDYIFNTGQIKHFSYLDYNFFVFTLFVSTFIGFYQAWRSRSNVGLDEYFLASRSMSAFPVSLSLMASFSSSLLIMGTSAEVYVFSTIYFWMGATYIVGTLIAAYTFIPIFYNLKITSVYEYLELRFSRSLRLACSSMYILAIIVYLSVVIYAPSTAIHAVTGLDLWGSIVTVGVVCTIYTAAGGMKAVIWTDVFQSAVTYTGILLMFIRSFMKVGSVSTVWESAKRTNRNRIFDFRLQSSLRHTVWSLMVGGSSIALTIASTQTQVMRCNACRSLHEATKAQFLQVIELMVIFYICMLIGMDLSSFYENCDPLKANLVDNPIQVMPLYMMDILGDTSGLPGLYLACLISATLSSISSGLNSVAAVITEDYIKVYFIPNLREKKSHTISQIVSVVFGTLCLEFTHIASKLEHLLQSTEPRHYYTRFQSTEPRHYYTRFQSTEPRHYYTRFQSSELRHYYTRFQSTEPRHYYTRFQSTEPRHYYTRFQSSELRHYYTRFQSTEPRHYYTRFQSSELRHYYTRFQSTEPRHYYTRFQSSELRHYYTRFQSTEPRHYYTRFQSSEPRHYYTRFQSTELRHYYIRFQSSEPRIIIPGFSRQSRDIITPGFSRQSRDIIIPGFSRQSRDIITPGFSRQSRDIIIPGFSRQSRDIITPGFSRQSRDIIIPGFSRQSRDIIIPGFSRQSRDIITPGFSRQSRDIITPGFSRQSRDIIIPGFSRQSRDIIIPGFSRQSRDIIPGFSRQSRDIITPGFSRQSRDIIIPGFSRQSRDIIIPGFSRQSREIIIPGFSRQSRDIIIPGFSRQNRDIIPGFSRQSRDIIIPGFSRQSRDIIPGFSRQSRDIIPGFSRQS